MTIKKFSSDQSIQRYVTVVVALVTLSWLALQSFYKLQTPLLRADFISTLVPGIAPFKGLGSPYLNYWEIRPPALPLMTGLWGALIGTSLWSFHLLWLLFLAGIMWMTWVILGRLFSFWEKILIYFAFGLLFFANSVQTQFFPPEINGLFFSLAGLIFALKNKPFNRDIFFSSFFFILAGQMKEVFALVGISLLPHFVIKLFGNKQELWQFVRNVVAGIALAAFIILIYLLLIEALSAYGELLAYKSSVFNPTDFGALFTRLSPALRYLTQRFFILPYRALLLLFATTGVVLFLWFKKNITQTLVKKNQRIVQFIFSQPLSKTITLYAVALLFCLGSFAGYLMQNRYNHIYDIAILLSFILLIALVGKIFIHTLLNLLPVWQKHFSRSMTFMLSLAFIGLLFIPNQQLWSENFSQIRDYNPRLHAARWFNTEKKEQISMETKIKNNTSLTDCIDVQHGWNVGQQYYYSQRRPCTRFFLTNILPPEKISEYQQQLVSNPPAALVYITVLTDLNVESFEQNIFNFSKVIDACFIQDDEFETLYWPAFEKREFKECFKKGLPES